MGLAILIVWRERTSHFLARLIHVAEVYDVLTVPGRYRPTVSPDRAFEIIERGKGHQFDPQLVEVLGKVVQ